MEDHKEGWDIGWKVGGGVEDGGRREESGRNRTGDLDGRF